MNDKLLTAARNVLLWSDRIDTAKKNRNMSMADVINLGRFELLQRNALAELREAVKAAGG